MSSWDAASPSAAVLPLTRYGHTRRRARTPRHAFDALSTLGASLSSGRIATGWSQRSVRQAAFGVAAGGPADPMMVRRTAAMGVSPVISHPRSISALQARNEGQKIQDCSGVALFQAENRCRIR